MLINNLKDFNQSIKRLEESLSIEVNDIVRDSSIKRFELCFDLAWKSIKSFAKFKGIECFSPRDCFKSAFQIDLIEHDEKWLEMIKDRNLPAHLYKKSHAQEAYSRLPDYLILFKNLHQKLEENNE